jgi:hypothetical protein
MIPCSSNPRFSSVISIFIDLEPNWLKCPCAKPDFHQKITASLASPDIPIIYSSPSQAQDADNVLGGCGPDPPVHNLVLAFIDAGAATFFNPQVNCMPPEIFRELSCPGEKRNCDASPGFET